MSYIKWITPYYYGVNVSVFAYTLILLKTEVELYNFKLILNYLQTM